MITLTGTDFYNSLPTLNSFCQSYKLPTKVAYRLARILKKMQEEFKTLDEHRIAIIKEFGKAQEDGNYKVDDSDKENFENFRKKMDELLAEEIKIDLDPVDLSLVKVDITAAELVVLDKFFTGEPE